jgi:hypothetical protein
MKDFTTALRQQQHPDDAPPPEVVAAMNAQLDAEAERIYEAALKRLKKEPTP